MLYKAPTQIGSFSRLYYIVINMINGLNFMNYLMPESYCSLMPKEYSLVPYFCSNPYSLQFLNL